ncbi:MAG: plasmid pRiA4b ORF-3 family protein [Acidimicrobiia bacterium]
MERWSRGSARKSRCDSGDGSEHDVAVEAIESPQEGARYPLGLGGKRASPPEDCGGVADYEEPLRVLADPNDPEREHRGSWAPDGFDPAVFDLLAANRRLRSP